MSTVCGMHVRQLLAAYNEYSSWHADNTIACSTQWVQFMACRQHSCLLNTYVTIWQLVIVTMFDESVQCFLLRSGNCSVFLEHMNTEEEERKGSLSLYSTVLLVKRKVEATSPSPSPNRRACHCSWFALLNWTTAKEELFPRGLFFQRYRLYTNTATVIGKYILCAYWGHGVVAAIRK